MRIIVTGGGTAGHVTPLLAVASEIKKDEPSAEIIFVGKRLDNNLNNLVKNSPNIDKSYTIFAGKLRRFHGKKLTWYITQPKLVLQNIRDFILFAVGLLESLIVLILKRPDVVFVKGGYVGLPVGLVASFLRIPIITHDSDTLPGLTNRILSKYATRIGVGQPIENYPKYPKSKLVYCGVPIKSDYFSMPASNKSKQDLGITSNEQVIAVIGGSLGAVRLNEAILKTLDKIATAGRVVYWISGYNHFNELNQQVKKINISGKVILEPFTNQAEVILNAADLVISRTGATFLAELAALGKATILVPNPLLTGGHQLENAKTYADKNAAIVLQEKEIKDTPQKIAENIKTLLSSDSYRRQLEDNMAQFSVPESANIIARLILNIGARQ